MTRRTIPLLTLVLTLCLGVPAFAIVDGEETADLPAIRMLTDKYGKMRCTLQFLSDTTALTAAHCLGDLNYDDCKVTREEEENHYYGRFRTFTCASYFRCNAWVQDKAEKDTIEAKSCFVPKAYYVGTELLELLPLANLLVTGRSLQPRELFYGFTPFDIAVLVFPKGTSEKIGLKKEDYLKITRRAPEAGMDVLLIGYGNNTGKDKTDTGAGQKRKGTNRVSEVNWRTVRVNGKTRNRLDNGVAVSTGKGDSGSALVSLRARDKGRILAITSGGYKDRGFPEAAANASYFGAAGTDVALQLYGDAYKCDEKKSERSNLKNSALGYCADDIVSLSAE